MKWICCLSCCLLLMCTFVQAENEEVITELGTIEEFSERMNSEVASFSTLDFVRRVGKIDGTKYEMFFSIMEIDGNLVYCIEPGIYAGTGMSYEVDYEYLDEQTKQRLFRITNVGYQNAGHDGDEWFVATQLAVWRALGLTQYSAKTLEGEVWDVSQEVAEIERLASSFGNTASFSGQKLKADKGEAVTVLDEHGVISGFEVCSKKGLDVKQNGNQLTLTLTGECEEATISGSKGLKTGGLVYARPGRQTVYMVTRSEEPVSYDLTLKMKTGDIRIQKLNEDGQIALGNHHFELIDELGKRVMITGAEVIEVQDGVLEIIGQLPKGKYILKELSTVYPYKLSHQNVEFTVESEQMNEVQFVNEFTETSLIVLKKDQETLQPLDNAEFTISVMDSNGELKQIEQGMTVDGMLEITSVKYGEKVQVCETKAPEGYLMSKDACQLVMMTPLENEKVVVEFVNQRQQIPLVIRKRDKNNKELLSGALFSIQSMNDTGEWVEIAQKETHQGITEEILLDGEEMIQVCEIKAPTGYVLPEKACQNVVVQANENEHLILDFEDELRKLSLKIIKRDAHTQELLNGAEFLISVYDELTEKWKDAAQKTTGSLHTEDKTGVIEVNQLNYGQKVKVCEIKAPQGYQKQESCQEIEMISESDEIELVIENERRDIEVQIYKVDSEDGRLLNDAYFSWVKENSDSGFGMTGRLLVQFKSDIPFPAEVEVFADSECTDLLMEGKTDETGEYVAQCEDEEVFVRLKETDEIQKVHLLPGGFSLGKVKYGEQVKVCEVIAPTGYQIHEACQWIDVRTDEEFLKILIENERIQSYEEVPSMGLD